MTKHEHNEREKPAQSLSEETCRRILALRDARGWSAYHHPKDLAISISLEAAELLELFQWSGEDAECLQKRGAMLEELADIATYAVLLAYRLHDSKRYFKLRLSAKSMFSMLFAAVSAGLFYLTDSIVVDVVMVVVACVMLLLVAPGVIRRK